MYRITGIGQKFGSSIIILTIFLCCPISSTAQLQVGDNLSMTMEGSLGFGYSGAFGNYGASSHAQGFGANANLRGYYFHPNFVSFDVRPYFNRASSNAESQSITRGTGFGASASFFGGSYFPASVSYGQDYSSNSEFFIGGVPSVLGDSSGSYFGLTWSELLPRYPHVYVSYNANSSSSTLLSTTEENHNSSKNLNVNSEYKLAGWTLNGNLNYNHNSFSTPEFLTGEIVSFGGSGTTIGAQAQHNIPFGGVGLGISHSSYSSDQGGSGSGTNYYEGAGVTFFRRLSLNESFNYTTNTTAALGQSILSGATPVLQPDINTSGMNFTSSANLQVGWGVALNGNFSHRRAMFNGQEHADSQYGGGVSFHNQSRFLGFLTFSVGVVDTANKEGNSGTGLVGSVTASKKLGHWDTSADFGYFQSIQTLYAISTTSSYSYGGSVRRKLNPQIHWAVSYRGTHSGLTRQAGNSSESNSYATYFSWKRYTLGANYSQSEGLAVLNANGAIVPTPVGPLVGDNVYVFDAKSWGVNASTTLFRHLNVSGGFSTVSSNTLNGLFATASNGDRYYARMQYSLRRFEIQGGYNYINQDVSTIPGGPRIFNSFYITLSRWFNVF
jgi:hypothetical protein